MKLPATLLTLTMFFAPAMGFCKDAPPVQDIIARAIAAAGGAESFAALGVLKLSVTEQENPSSGPSLSGGFEAFADAASLANLRLELPGDVILGRHGQEAWALIQGQVDQRPQSPKHAMGTLNQKIFPLMLPFSLTAPELRPLAAVESSFEGTPTWRMAVSFPANFFTSPVMNTTWRLEFSQADGTLVCAELQPPAEFAEQIDEGVRYTFLRHTGIDGVQLPVEILMDGIDRAGRPNGHTRVTRVEHQQRGPFEPGLFMHPQRLDQIEEGMIP